MTVSFPAFSEFSDACMAALASRSHEWRYWEISERIEGEAAAATARAALLAQPARRIALLLERTNHEWVAITVDLADRPSPSATLERLLAGGEPSRRREFTTLPEWAPTPLFSSDRDDELPENWRSASIEMAKRGYLRVFFAHAKNSQGEYRQVLSPIF